jgi:hypothetical protein
MGNLLGGLFRGGENEGCELLLFFLLLVIIFCNSGCFGEGCELLFFFLILVVLFCSCGNGLFGGLCSTEA